jgi:hypothetical protein
MSLPPEVRNCSVLVTTVTILYLDFYFYGKINVVQFGTTQAHQSFQLHLRALLHKRLHLLK